MILRFFHQDNAVSWFNLIALIIILLVCLVVFYVSRGFAFYYIKAKINSTIKNVLIFIQLVGSFVLALALPNNYLNEFPAINDYYTKKPQIL